MDENDIAKMIEMTLDIGNLQGRVRELTKQVKQLDTKYETLYERLMAAQLKIADQKKSIGKLRAQLRLKP